MDRVKAKHRRDLSSSTPFGLVSQPRRGNHEACDQAGLDGYSVARTNYGANVVVAVVDIAAAAAVVVMVNQRRTLVADFGDEDARSMDSVASEDGQRKVRHRRLKVKEEER